LASHWLSLAKIVVDNVAEGQQAANSSKMVLKITGKFTTCL